MAFSFSTNLNDLGVPRDSFRLLQRRHLYAVWRRRKLNSREFFCETKSKSFRTWVNIVTMATQDIPLSTAEKLSSSNLINNKNLFAKVSQRFGLLPGAQGLNDISQVIEEGTQTLGSGSPLDQVRREAEVVADDVILNFGKEELKKAPNKFCKTMRRTVKELSARHDIAFKGMVNKLNLDSSNPFQTFVNVADEIFDDGQINWGRIVAVYAFAARLATRDTDKSDFPKKIALFVGKYVANKLGKWILDHGGWVSPLAFQSCSA